MYLQAMYAAVVAYAMPCLRGMMGQGRCCGDSRLRRESIVSWHPLALHYNQCNTAIALTLAAAAAWQTVDTTGFGWLDFTMSDENKKKLFREGAIAGVNLLARWAEQSAAQGRVPETSCSCLLNQC